MQSKNLSSDFSSLLLPWFHKNKRALPFRVSPTPYHVWVSEVMLQQTRISAMVPFYERFMLALPTIADLAACDEQKLHKLWEGLGYYSRVRNLQKAAQMVVGQYGGELPGSYEKLLALPGIGAYTAGAVASLAFGLREVAVDGNVLRVFSRLLAETGDVTDKSVKGRLSQVVKEWQPTDAPGPFNEAVMELGALVCIPGTPRCNICPVSSVCLAYKKGIADALPCLPAKKAKKTEKWTVLLVRRGAEVLLCRRPSKGLLANMWQPPMLAGTAGRAEVQEFLNSLAPGGAVEKKLPPAEHVFTHKIWKMQGWDCTLPPDSSTPPGYSFVLPINFENGYALPSAFKYYDIN